LTTTTKTPEAISPTMSPRLTQLCP
jgi:hypothetical protein